MNDLSFPASTPTPAPVAASAPSRYVSIFEDPDRFGKMLQIADAISKSSFVPEAFRGQSADCLVVLDIAARYNLEPFAVFQDVYLIDKRPAFSSKFLIALVNCSGRFSRIQYETGIDGEADVTVATWGSRPGERKKEARKVPNFYAIASFVDLASGQEYKSPRVDLNFAERAGWVGKMESMWIKSPEIMVQYRAASILIKSVCPEVVLGLEFADDLRDARKEDFPAPTPSPAPRRVEVTTSPAIKSSPAANAETIANFISAIQIAATEAELADVAKRIAATALVDKDRATLREEYAKRREFLTRIQPGESILSEVTLAHAIANAESVAAIQSVRDAIAAAVEEERIDAKVAARVLDLCDEREAEFVDDDDEAEDEIVEPSAEQKDRGRELLENIRAAVTAKTVDGIVRFARDAAEGGDITREQLAALENVAKEKKEELKK